MTRSWAIRLLAALAAIGLTMTVATADEGSASFAAHLNGFRETTSILTDGTASFRATVHGDSVSYTLTFSGLTTGATMSHLHFAQPGVNGGIFVWLCGNANAPIPVPAGTPMCSVDGLQTSGSVSGTFTAANILAVGTQNVSANDFEGALRIIRAGDAYANIHTVKFPAGEIRGQVHFGDD